MKDIFKGLTPEESKVLAEYLRIGRENTYFKRVVKKLPTLPKRK